MDIRILNLEFKQITQLEITQIITGWSRQLGIWISKCFILENKNFIPFVHKNLNLMF